MAIHEFGHVFGALISGGQIEKIVLHPLTISRTDVSPNPNPLVVIWLGPIIGCAVPTILYLLTPRQLPLATSLSAFFAGFCLIANGAYLAVGAVDQVGDCKVMIQNGSPVISLIAFGVTAVLAGLLLWHKIGSVKEFLVEPNLISSRFAWSIAFAAMLIIFIEFTVSPI